MPVAVVLGLVAVAACTAKNNAKYPGAVATAGAGVAMAGVYRAATGGCWASCPVGMECDEVSGTCLDLPCHGDCPAEHRCVHDTCVRGEPDVSARGPADVGPADAGPADAGPASSTAPAAAPCSLLCLPSERCVTEDGGSACRPRPIR
jgi:hypothetical protein